MSKETLHVTHICDSDKKFVQGQQDFVDVVIFPSGHNQNVLKY